MQQQTIMNVCPAQGTPKPYPSHAAQWREYHGTAAWLFNPWGDGKQRRSAQDVGSDPFGLLIVPTGEAICAAKTSTPAARFTIRDGITTDRSTGLQWAQQGSDQRFDHAGAVAHCEAFRLGGFTDWRLPMMEELRGLVDYSRRNPAIDTAAFDCKPEAYWSSSPVAGWPGHAWGVYFGGGLVHYWDRYDELFVRPVRGPVAAPGQ